MPEVAGSGFSQAVLLGQPQDMFRSLALIRQGYLPDFTQALPRSGEPSMLQLMGSLNEQPRRQSPPGPERLWRLYSLPDPDFDSTLQRYRQRLLENIWSVRYLLADPDTAAEIVSKAPQAYRMLLQYGNPLQLVGIEKRYYLPRVYFRTGVVAVASFAEFIKLLSVPGSLRPFQQVAVELPRHQSQGPELAPDAVIPTILQADAGRLEIEVSVPQAGYLVLADAAASRWQALLDGRPAQLETANGFQLAVWLEPGRHRISFRAG